MPWGERVVAVVVMLVRVVVEGRIKQRRRAVPPAVRGEVAADRRVHHVKEAHRLAAPLLLLLLLLLALPLLLLLRGAKIGGREARAGAAARGPVGVEAGNVAGAHVVQDSRVCARRAVRGAGARLGVALRSGRVL